MAHIKHVFWDEEKTKCAIIRSAHSEGGGRVADGRVRHTGHLVGLVVVPEFEPELVAVRATSHHGVDSPWKQNDQVLRWENRQFL